MAQALKSIVAFVLLFNFSSALPLGGAFQRRLRPLSIHQSRMTCNITGESKFSMCMVTNAYYWKKQFYFISDVNGTQLYTPHFVLPHFRPMPPNLLIPITAPQLTQQLKGVKQVIQVSQGILMHRLYPNNYYHALWETLANEHVLACKMFDKCEYDPNEKELQVLYYDREVSNTSLRHAQLHQCITSNPYIAMAETNLDQPVRIMQLTFGMGPEAFGQGNVIWKRQPPSDLVRQTWQHRMRECMGMGAWAPDVKELAEHVVMIAQRPRGKTGRSISNVEQVAEWLQAELPGFQVQIQRFEGLTTQEQAALWARATVVVSTHGAQLSNAFYMPNNSAVVEVDQASAPRFSFYSRHVVRKLAPFLNIEHFFCTPIGPGSVNISRRAELLEARSFKLLTEEQRKTWMKEPHCSYKWLDKLKGECQGNWMKWYTDIIVEQKLLVGTLVKVKAWLKKQGLGNLLLSPKS